MNRCRIWSTPCGVAISYVNDEQRRVIREFYAPVGRVGYVREYTRDGSNPQVCERLYSTGRTLEASLDGLLDLVRREWRRRRRDEVRS